MKNIKKRLALSTETIRQLDTTKLAGVNGGAGANTNGDAGCAPTEWYTCRISCAGTCHTPCGTQDPTGAGN